MIRCASTPHQSRGECNFTFGEVSSNPPPAAPVVPPEQPPFQIYIDNPSYHQITFVSTDSDSVFSEEMALPNDENVAPDPLQLLGVRDDLNVKAGTLATLTDLYDPAIYTADATCWLATRRSGPGT